MLVTPSTLAVVPRMKASSPKPWPELPAELLRCAHENNCEPAFRQGGIRMSLALLFMSAQELEALPALVYCTTVMVAADDLRMFYARGDVIDLPLTFNSPHRSEERLLYHVAYVG